MNQTVETRGRDEPMSRLLLDSIVDYAIFRVSPEGTVQTWNTGAQHIKGYAAGEIIGQSIAVFYTDEDRRSGLPGTVLQSAAAGGRFENEGWRVRKDGTRFWAHVVIDAIRDPEGELLGFAKVTRDISVQRELERTKEQLLQAQKLEIVGHLTGGIAHDFNNLLTAIIACFDLIGREGAGSRIETLVGSGTTAALRGQKLVGQLLAFARKQELRPQPSSVNAVIATLQPLIDQAIGETVHLHTAYSPDVGRVDLDQAQFQSAILNLVLNARDAMLRVGGHLTIRTSDIHIHEAEATIDGTLTPGNYVAVEIEDTGVGMSSALCERAIEPFYTTKDVGLGSGLGLSQVYGFAVQSGGGLQIDSVPGQGTTVRVLLPMMTDHSVAAVVVAPQTRQAVLVVEDDPDVLRAAIELLRTREVEIYTAMNASEALRILQRQTPIDVLFTDIVMPGGISGVDVAEQAMRMRPKLNVLLTSGYARDALREKHGIGDQVAFLPKPYRLAALSDALDQLFALPAANHLAPPLGMPRA